MKRQRTKLPVFEGRMLPLHQVRKVAGLNQRAFGELFGLSQTLVSQLESGIVTLPASKRVEIEAALGVRIKWPE